MSTVMVILGALLFFGGVFAALAGLSAGASVLLAIIGALLFVLAGPQKKREREDQQHQETLNK